VRVVALLSTIPARRLSCERLLRELSAQRRKPDGVLLRLDGYADTLAPRCPLPVVLEHRTPTPSGAGGRWLLAAEALPENCVAVNIDDDAVLTDAPDFVGILAEAAEVAGGAAAAMGRTATGRAALPVGASRGKLTYACGLGLTVRAGLLKNLRRFAASVAAAGGPDALGLNGDDDALVSAYLWARGSSPAHAPPGNVYAAPGTRDSSQSAARAARGEPPDAQKIAIKKITGWPWLTL